MAPRSYTMQRRSQHVGRERILAAALELFSKQGSARNMPRWLVVRTSRRRR